MKRCPDCGVEKSLDLFPRNRTRRDGRQAYCKECWNIRIRRHKQKLDGGERSFLLTRRYGISAVEADELLARQGGLCAICRTKPAKHVDHCQ